MATKGQGTTTVAVAYLLLMVVVVWSPTPLTDSLMPWLSRFDLSARARLGTAPGRSLQAVEFAANAAMFIPPAALLARRLRLTSWPLVVLAGFAATLIIEGVQLLWLPQRSATISDIVANTLGAFVGAVGVFIARSRTQARVDSGSPQIRISGR